MELTSIEFPICDAMQINLEITGNAGSVLILFNGVLSDKATIEAMGSLADDRHSKLGDRNLSVANEITAASNPMIGIADVVQQSTASPVTNDRTTIEIHDLNEVVARIGAIGPRVHRET